MICWLSSNHAFFWDTIQLGSKHAHFFYETGFSSLLLPTEIDSGHPPYFGMYLAGCWMVFGKTLAVSHWAMLPFLVVLVVQWLSLGRRLVGKTLLPLFLLFLLIDPVVASQASLVSPDIVLAACFLMLLNSIYSGKKKEQVIAVVGLGMVSTRGMMLAIVVFAWELMVKQQRVSSESWLRYFQRVITPYLPGGVLAASYLLYHYLSTGWIGFHAESEWAPSFEKADLQQFSKNLVVLVWRFLDFGRVFLLSGTLLCGFVLWRSRAFRKGKIDPELKRVSMLFLLLLVGSSITFLSYSGLQQHRYLLPLFLLLTLVFFLLLKELPSEKWRLKHRNSLLSLVAIGVVTGNLWIYPDRISQGWDSTLAHWPFYQLRMEMLDFVEEREIPLLEIGTAFPEIGSLKFKDLNERVEGYKEKDLRTDPYILYSNVMNDFSDAELWRLQEEWIPLHALKHRGIKMILYKRPAE
ncbi:MAG: hypothetical protein HRU41_41625 [Saprospiraceae bacterium]|nr:hypothetical protein [Saprospiraceae bacterium]